MPVRSLLAVLTLAAAALAQSVEHVDLIGCDHCARTKQCLGLPRELAEGSPDTRAINTTTTDLTNYDLDITINLAASTISGSNTISMSSLVEGLTGVTLRLSNNFTISSVELNGAPATWFRLDSVQFNVNLDRPYSIGEAFTIKVTYSGTPTSGGSFGSIIFRTRNGNREAYTLSETDYAYTWFPCKENNLDKCTADLRFTVPNGNTVASNGTLLSTTPVGGTQTRFHYRTTYPTATYLYFFSVTNFNTYTNTWNYTPAVGTPVSMPLKFFLYPESDTASNRNAWFNCSNMLTAFSPDTRFGLYPFSGEKYGIYQFGFGGGMEHQTCTGQGTFSESVTAHELGHQWWGDMVTCASWNHIWLNEGFATYSEALWNEWKPGSTGLPALFSSMASRRPSTVNGTVWCPTLTDMNRIFSTDFSYRKGAWVLHMLRRVMGDTAFFQALRNHREFTPYGSATTEDFQAACEAAYGASLNWFFQQWIYQPGAPSYTYAFRSVIVNGQVFIEVFIRQIQTASYPTYTMPIDLVVVLAGGSTLNKTVFNDARAQHFLFPATSTASTMNLDPNQWILWTSATTVAFVEGPPKVVYTFPLPGTSAPSASVPSVSFTCQKAINVNASQVTLTGPAPSTATVPATFAYDAPTLTATLTPLSPLAPGDYTLTALDTITAVAGALRLDGELPAPDSPTFPSGNGVFGGNLSFTFTVTPPPGCTGDIDLDGQRNTADLTILLASFGTSVAPGTSGDINSDGVVDTADLAVLLGVFGQPCP